MPKIDGALVGGASLKPDFVDLVRRGGRGVRQPLARSSGSEEAIGAS